MSSPIRIQLGKNVRKVRYEIGMTQQQFADGLGVNIRYAQRIETGEANIGPDVITGLPAVLGAHYDVLTLGIPRNPDDWRKMKGPKRTD